MKINVCDYILYCRKKRFSINLPIGTFKRQGLNQFTQLTQVNCVKPLLIVS